MKKEYAFGPSILLLDGLTSFAQHAEFKGFININNTVITDKILEHLPFILLPLT